METVKEWLESIENKSIREKALFNWNTQASIYSESAKTLKEAIDRIVWYKTAEGFEFWETYYDSL